MTDRRHSRTPSAIRIGLAAVAALVLLPGPAAARETPRPPDGGPYAYGRPEAPPYAAGRVVVHYTRAGPDRPPPRDDDLDGVPSYVENVGAAADRALRTFEETLHLRPPAEDVGGPDARPDIYVKDLGGDLGHAVPATVGEDGAFVLIPPTLRTRASADLDAGLGSQVAHELGHLVQFAYLPGGMPFWVAESTASFLGVAGNLGGSSIDDILIQYWARYARHPERSLYDLETQYGTFMWWFYVGRELSTFLFDQYFRRLGREAAAGGVRRGGLAALDALTRRGGLVSLRHAFFAFSVRHHEFVTGPPLYRIAVDEDPGRTAGRRIAPMSAHYVRLRVPVDARTLDVRVSFLGRAVGRAGLLQGRLSSRRPELAPLSRKEAALVVPLRRGRVTTWRSSLPSGRANRRLELVITGPSRRTARYRIVTRMSRTPAVPVALRALAPAGWRVRRATPRERDRIPPRVRAEARELGVLVDPGGHRSVVARFGARVTEGAGEDPDLRLMELEYWGTTDSAVGHDVVRLPGGRGYAFTVANPARVAQGAWWADRPPDARLRAAANARGHRGFLYETTLARERGLRCDARAARDVLPWLSPAPPPGASRRESFLCIGHGRRVKAVLIDPRRPRAADAIVASLVARLPRGAAATLPCGAVHVSRVGGDVVAIVNLRTLLGSRRIFAFAARDLDSMTAVICRAARGAVPARSGRPPPLRSAIA